MSEMDRSIVTAFVTSGRFLASAVKLSKHPVGPVSPSPDFLLYSKHAPVEVPQ